MSSSVRLEYIPSGQFSTVVEISTSIRRRIDFENARWVRSFIILIVYCHFRLSHIPSPNLRRRVLSLI